MPTLNEIRFIGVVPSMPLVVSIDSKDRSICNFNLIVETESEKSFTFQCEAQGLLAEDCVNLAKSTDLLYVEGKLEPFEHNVELMGPFSGEKLVHKTEKFKILLTRFINLSASLDAIDEDMPAHLNNEDSDDTLVNT